MNSKLVWILADLFTLIIMSVAIGCSGDSSDLRSLSDLGAVKKADQAYVKAWLTNDPNQVMETLTSDAVIVPSGLQAIKGVESIQRFWWPKDSPPANITSFELVQEEVDGWGNIAYVRGSFKLKFTYSNQDFSNQGTYISILKCNSEGIWRISHRSWNDHAL